jgi:DNA invertase Pin-like site-specific DNA recombinase
LHRATIENQRRELRQIAERRGWEVIKEYHDVGVIGAKGREARPGLDEMLKDAQRRRFDVVMAWAIDRLGRSLIDLLGTIQTLEHCGVDLYLDQQSIDTTTPGGRLMFQITGAFAEFERSMIRQRIRAGLRRAVDAGKRLGRPKTPNALAGGQRGAGQVHRQKTDASDVSARPTQAPNESAPHPVVTEPDDRHGLRGTFRGLGGRRAVGHDGINSQSQRFRREFR